MKTTDRIVAHLPRFYRATEESSFLYSFVNGFARVISEQERDLALILSSHWVDSAHRSDLDLLASIAEITRKRNEIDDDFRIRIKRTFLDLEKNGTVQALKAQLATFLAIPEDEIVIVENPVAPIHLEKKVLSGDTWIMASNSINDERAEIIIYLDAGEVKDPTILDLDSMVSLRFNGRLGKGDTLKISQEGKAELNGIDVTPSISVEVTNGSNPSSGPSASQAFKIPRRPSKWMFRESLKSSLARFDQSRFDSSVFYEIVPPITIKANWYANLLAAFEVRVPLRALEKNDLSKHDLEVAVNTMKAAGVQAIITVLEDKPQKSEVRI